MTATKKRSALLIGGTGFVGRHMQGLLAPDFDVIATGHEHDIAEPGQVDTLVADARPDIVINFASITTVRESFEAPLLTYRIGFLGTFNLLAALKRHGFQGRMLNISSSEVYGFPPGDELPTTEFAPLRPMSPYSVSKAATEALCYQWSQTGPFEIVTARPFTHIGPGQSDRFVLSSFAKQIAEVMLKKREPIMRVGALSTTRDFTDVRDVARAYRSLLENGANGQVYNVCSGTETSIRHVLDELIRSAGIEIAVVRDEERARGTEQRRTCGSHKKLTSETGWNPTIPLHRTVADALEYWVAGIRTLGSTE